jgi:predicted Rossmann fold flavoprotein
MVIAVIGGGAAGFFAAIHAKINFPDCEVRIYEKSSKLLSKVKISGGGRCNVTHACYNQKDLANYYPRGSKFLYRAFYQFDAKSTVDWFQDRGVQLKTYPDGCIFPISNNSQTIIDCFLAECNKLGIQILLNAHVQSILPLDTGFGLQMLTEKILVDKVIVTTGGQPKASGMLWIKNLGLSVVEPVPSLFTFNMPNEGITALMGNVVERTMVRIEGLKLVGRGPLLITHWGMSGPAVLQLSSWGARWMEEKSYCFYILINWLNDATEVQIREVLSETILNNPLKKIVNVNPFPITLKIWTHLLSKSGISSESLWGDLGKKTINKLINTLMNDRYEVKGKTTFKEEFVTAGGVNLTEIDHNNMQAKKHPGLAFAGEILDIDGLTGGFNFQAAWTTAFIAGKHIGLA